MSSQFETVNLTFWFDSEYTVSPPAITITNNDEVLLPQTEISSQRTFSLTLRIPNDTVMPMKLQIHRSDFDGCNRQILSLKKLSLDGIDLARILHYSLYSPEYPEPWITEQRDAGHDWPLDLVGVLEWGWNGTWTLPYETPVYTWLLKNV